jgi:ribonuclease G
MISATPFGVRTAILSGGEILAFNAESHARPSLLGNIYLAAPGRHGGTARFVTIGDNLSAFIAEAGDPGAGDQLVQVVRDAQGGKAPRVATEPALAGRYLVYFPQGGNIGVARRIGDAAERARLLAIGQDVSRLGGGITLRSAAQGAPEELIRTEAARLRAQWFGIMAKRASIAAPALLLAGPALAERLLRDMVPRTIKRILVDDKKTHATLCAYAKEIAPDLLPCLEFTGDALFERHDAAGALAAALAPEVALPGGGGLTIEPTQALTIIDVDSGARAGGRESALRAACAEAIAAAAREIRRRNLTGLIVIDFPRLAGANAGADLLRDLRARMNDDPTPHKVVDISASGLMEITRRRTETPLLEALTEAVPGGGYRGRRARLDSLAFDVADQARLQVRAGARRATLHVAPELAEYLAHFDAEAGRKGIPALDAWLGVEVTVRQEPAYQREHWSIEAA